MTSFPVITNVAKLLTRTKRARVSHSCLSHPNSLDNKRNKKTCKIFETELFCRAAFIGRTKSEQLKKGYSLFIS